MEEITKKQLEIRLARLEDDIERAREYVCTHCSNDCNFICGRNPWAYTKNSRVCSLTADYLALSKKLEAL